MTNPSPKFGVFSEQQTFVLRSIAIAIAVIVATLVSLNFISGFLQKVDVPTTPEARTELVMSVLQKEPIRVELEFALFSNLSSQTGESSTSIRYPTGSSHAEQIEIGEDGELFIPISVKDITALGGSSVELRATTQLGFVKSHIRGNMSFQKYSTFCSSLKRLLLNEFFMLGFLLWDSDIVKPMLEGVELHIDLRDPQDKEILPRPLLMNSSECFVPGTYGKTKRR